MRLRAPGSIPLPGSASAPAAGHPPSMLPDQSLPPDTGAWSRRARSPRRALPAVLCAVVALSLVAVVLLRGYHSRNERLPLLCAGIGLAPNGSAQCLPAKATTRLRPGTRVIESADPRSAALGGEQARWLAAGTIPRSPAAEQDMVRSALLDLHVLTLGNGALVAGQPTFWRYVWPRDASFAAVALAQTGHLDDAAKILGFLQQVQPASGVFQARYLPDGSGVPDARGDQTDGTGWVLWALDAITAGLSPQARPTFLTPLRPLVLASTRAGLDATDTPTGLPAPSMDYWEVPTLRLSLGTVAPIAAGLAAASRLLPVLGRPGLGRQAGARSALIQAAVQREFGRHGYGRYLGDDKVDTSITFLLPPFTSTLSPDVLRARGRAQHEMKRPAGGLAPGAGWKDDGISWTPETALFALSAASTGDAATARAWLTWLAQHRTDVGALPEKVLSNGKPAGAAPLAWTDAVVVLAAQALATDSRH